MLVQTQTTIKFNLITFLIGIFEISLFLTETWSESPAVCAIASIIRFTLSVAQFIIPILCKLVFKVVLYALQEIEIILFQLDKIVYDYFEQKLGQYRDILQLIRI
ncbi:MAG TPA: hypothetical protein V6C58_23670 [Allocoleopsis sp.]